MRTGARKHALHPRARLIPAPSRPCHTPAMARDDPMFGPYGRDATREARAVFTALTRRGGSIRVASLLRRFAPEQQRVLFEAIDELRDRYWITIAWRKAPPGLPEDAPRPLSNIDRLVSTRFGRRKYRAAWLRTD
jgi:hypothetical protein